MWHGEVRVWPLLVGLVLSVALVSGVVSIGIANGLFAAFKSGPLFGAAAVAAGIFAAALAAIYVAHFAGAALSPIMVICILLGLANAVYGFSGLSDAGLATYRSGDIDRGGVAPETAAGSAAITLTK